MKKIITILLLIPCVVSADVGRFHITEKGAPQVWIVTNEEAEGNSSVSIFQRSTNTPYAGFVDKDGDGVFDLLTYSVLDANGEETLESKTTAWMVK